MSWSTLWFGKHKGKTLPQVVFSDPDWFFWAIKEGVFKGKGKIFEEAQEINRKSKKIRIPQKGPERLVAEYAIHPPTKKFGHMEILSASHPTHVGSTPTFRSKCIDLSIPGEIAPYDKLGCKHLISDLKYYLFGSKSYRMTKDRCEAFFEEDNNFDAFVKSRHSGENRSPDGLQLIEKTGFRVKPGMTENGIFGLFTKPSTLTCKFYNNRVNQTARTAAALRASFWRPLVTLGVPPSASLRGECGS